MTLVGRRLDLMGVELGLGRGCCGDVLVDTRHRGE